MKKVFRLLLSLGHELISEYRSLECVSIRNSGFELETLPQNRGNKEKPKSTYGELQQEVSKQQ